MARAWHPPPHPSMTYFYIGCQPRNAWIPVHAASLLPASTPRPSPAILLVPLPSQARTCTEPQQGGTWGLSFLSLTTSCPAHTLGLACHCAGLPGAARCWAAARVTQWPADLGKNRCPNKFLSKRNYLGIRKPHGGGEDRHRCMTFKYAVTILQKFK